MDAKIADVQEKIKKEKMVMDGAQKLFQLQNNPAAKQVVESSILESQARLEFLEGELKKLHLRAAGGGKVSFANSPTSLTTTPFDSLIPTGTGTTPVTVLGGSQSSSTSSLEVTDDKENNGARTVFDLLRYGTTITSEKVKYRLKEVRQKLDLEQKVKTGTENLVQAMGPMLEADPRRKLELETQLLNSKAKESILSKAAQRYSQLYFDDEETSSSAEEQLTDVNTRKTGRLRIRLIGASNITGRKSLKEDMLAVVSVDGVVKYTSRPAKQKWDEICEIQLDKAQEVEIAVHERAITGSGSIMALCWFKVKDLEDDLNLRYGANRSANLDVHETWLDLENSGQILVKLFFQSVQRTKTERDRVFRRNAVDKVYPRNGHRFLAQQFYQVMQCAVCNEFLGRQGYQCKSCKYVCHAKCYERVITKCIPPEDMNSVADKNTGQLLKYKIPHRFAQATNLGASWCCHCGYLLGIGRKIQRCSECSKSAHPECSAMVPHFCGLAPDMADTLVRAWEEHEKKLFQKELEEAEKARNATPLTFEGVVDPSQLGPALEFSPDRPQALQVHLGQDTRPSLTSITSPSETILPPPSERPSQVISSYSPSVTSAHASISHQPPRTSAIKNVSLDDFHFVAVLGRGAFGKVMLGTEKYTNQLYAVKALKKEFIIQNDDVKSTKLEKFIFQEASRAHHPFLVNLHSSFQTDSRVYFVMEYVPGGDLMCHIQGRKRFSQSLTRFYACEVLLALDYFHQNNIVYRDLKLDNILLGADGHIKVADYGICKANMPYGATTSTFCGTPDYMAPEILMNRRYGVAVDWWSFGVLIYVMLVGRYPFHGEDENDILEAILGDAIEYPSNMPRVTLSLLQGLLNKNPSRRLGGGSSDADEVKKHPYFAGVDWNSILSKSNPAPFVPTINGAFDVSNFDKEFTAEQPVLTPINSVLSDQDQAEFGDFNYISEWAVQARIHQSLVAPH